MAVPRACIQSFVLRIWLEELPREDGRSVWRAHITDVATGERRYVQGIDGIVAFLVPRLERMGVKVSLRWRLQSWLGRARRGSTIERLRGTQ
jgi:hypothetical protein